MQELNQLKNLVIQTLQANGSLSNIRAQIRSSVFKVIDEPNTSKKVSPFNWENVKCQKLHEQQNGLNLLLIVKQFFQFYNMDYTNCVFASEANARTDIKRDQLLQKLGLTGKVDASKPILMYLIQKFKGGPEPSQPSINTQDAGKNELDHSRSSLSSQQNLGQSQGYDQSVDSSQLEDRYDYFQEVGKK